MSRVRIEKKTVLLNLLVLVTIPVFGVGYFWLDGNVMCISLLVAWLAFTLKNCSRKRVMVFAFSLTFFSFLLGEITVNQFDRSITVTTSDQMVHTYLCLFLSIQFVNLGVTWGTKKKSGYSGLVDDELRENTQNIKFREAARLMYLVFGCCQLASALERLFLVSILGSYTATYINFTSTLPGIVTKLSGMADIAFFLYLATMPNPRNMKLVIGLKITIGLVLLAYGMRNTIVLTVILLATYFILYEEMVGKPYSIIPKRVYVLALFMMPLILTFFDYLMAYRDGRSYTTSNVFDSAKHMITSLGGSVDVIEYGYRYADVIPDKIYSFGGIIDFFTQNIIARALFGARQYGGNTVEQALYGHSFSNTLTYLVKKDAFLRGYGMGSSYIAEVYHDFGYSGVCLINVIYGKILVQFNRLRVNHILANTIMIMASYYIIYAPRAYADGFLSCFLNFSFIFTFAIAYIWSKSKIGKRLM